MKKFLLSLALVALASPAFAAAISVDDWAALGATGIVAGDKTFVYHGSTYLLGTAATVEAADLGIVHQLNLANLGTVQSGFALDFQVSVNGTAFKISQTFVSQNHAAGSPTSSTVSASGATSYTDNLTATQPGAHNAWSMVDAVDFQTTGTTSATDILTNVTYTITQTAVPPVPEPSTFALAGLAVAGLVFARRRAR